MRSKTKFNSTKRFNSKRIHGGSRTIKNRKLKSRKQCGGSGEDAGFGVCNNKGVLGFKSKLFTTDCKDIYDKLVLILKEDTVWKPNQIKDEFHSLTDKNAFMTKLGKLPKDWVVNLKTQLNKVTKPKVEKSMMVPGYVVTGSENLTGEGDKLKCQYIYEFITTPLDNPSINIPKDQLLSDLKEKLVLGDSLKQSYHGIIKLKEVDVNTQLKKIYVKATEFMSKSSKSSKSTYFFITIDIKNTKLLILFKKDVNNKITYKILRVNETIFNPPALDPGSTPITLDENDFKKF
jgi:hypothetical protein